MSQILLVQAKDLLGIKVTSWLAPEAVIYFTHGQIVDSKNVIVSEKLIDDSASRREIFPHVLWTAQLWRDETEYIISQTNMIATGEFDRVRTYFQLCPRDILSAAADRLRTALTLPVFLSLDTLRSGPLGARLSDEYAFALCMRGNHKNEFTYEQWGFIAFNVMTAEHLVIVLRDCPHQDVKRSCIVRRGKLLSEEVIRKHVTAEMIDHNIDAFYHIFLFDPRLELLLALFPRVFIHNVHQFQYMDRDRATKYFLSYVTENDVDNNGEALARLFGDNLNFVRQHWRRILRINTSLISFVPPNICVGVILPEVTIEDVRAYPVVLARIFGKDPLFSRTYVREIYISAPKALVDLVDADVETLNITADDLDRFSDHLEALSSIPCINKVIRSAITMRHAIVAKLPLIYNNNILDTYKYEGIALESPDMVRRFASDDVFMRTYAIIAVRNNINAMQCFHCWNGRHRIGYLSKQFEVIPFEVAFAAHMDNAMFYKKYLSKRPYLRVRALLAGVNMRIVGINALQLMRLSDRSILRVLEIASQPNCNWRGQLHKVHLAVDHCPREGWLGVIPRDLFVSIMQYVWNCEMV